MAQKPTYALLTFVKGQFYVFTGERLWACYSQNHVRYVKDKQIKVDGYTFTLIDFDGSLAPWFRGSEVLFSGYAKIEQY